MRFSVSRLEWRECWFGPRGTLQNSKGKARSMATKSELESMVKSALGALKSWQAETGQGNDNPAAFIADSLFQQLNPPKPRKAKARRNMQSRENAAWDRHVANGGKDQLDYAWNEPGAPFRNGDY